MFRLIVLSNPLLHGSVRSGPRVSDMMEKNNKQTVRETPKQHKRTYRPNSRARVRGYCNVC